MNELYKVETELSKSLSEHASFFQDLDRCYQMFRYLKENFSSIEPAFRDGLFISAHVVYARCFSSGKRIALTKSIYEECAGEPMELHQMMMDMRNKHLAHSVNPFEDCQVGAMVANNLVIDVVTMAISHTHYDEFGIENCARLVLHARNFVSAKCKVLSKQCVEEFKKMPIKKIELGDRLKYTAPGPADAGKARP